MRREPHHCIARDVTNYRKYASSDTNQELIQKLREWNEFQRNWWENKVYVWRLFCRIHLEEAHKRGIITMKGGDT